MVDDSSDSHVEFDVSDCSRSLENGDRELGPVIRCRTQSGTLDVVSYTIISFTVVPYSRKIREVLPNMANKTSWYKAPLHQNGVSQAPN
jgi:hypothetical protein